MLRLKGVDCHSMGKKKKGNTGITAGRQPNPRNLLTVATNLTHVPGASSFSLPKELDESVVYSEGCTRHSFQVALFNSRLHSFSHPKKSMLSTTRKFLPSDNPFFHLCFKKRRPLLCTSLLKHIRGYVRNPIYLGETVTWNPHTHGGVFFLADHCGLNRWKIAASSASRSLMLTMI